MLPFSAAAGAAWSLVIAEVLLFSAGALLPSAFEVGSTCDVLKESYKSQVVTTIPRNELHHIMSAPCVCTLLSRTAAEQRFAFYAVHPTVWQRGFKTESGSNLVCVWLALQTWLEWACWCWRHTKGEDTFSDQINIYFTSPFDILSSFQLFF